MTGDSDLSVIDTKTNTVSVTIPLSFQPYGVTAGLDNSTLYIGDSDGGKLVVLNTTTGTVTASVAVAITETLLRP